MATKPAEKPTWNPTATNVTTPGAGQITSGWLPDDVPAPNTWNWLHYWAEQWITYFEDTTDEIAEGDRYRKLPVTGLATGGAAPSFGTNGSVDFPGGSGMLIHLDVPEKARLTAIRFTASHGGAVGALTIKLHTRPLAGPSALIGTLTWANEAEVTKELDVIVAVPPDGLLVDKDTGYYLIISNDIDPAVVFTGSYKADRQNFQ